MPPAGSDKPCRHFSCDEEYPNVQTATKRWTLILVAVLLLYAALLVAHQVAGVQVLPW